MLTRKTKTETLLDIVEEYRESGETWPATAKNIASWAVRNKKWDSPRKAVIDQCASELADAMREEIFTDPQNRRVRKKHAMRIQKLLPDGTYRQLHLWIDMTDSSRTELHIAFQQERSQVLGNCRQLKTDIDSFNESFNSEAPIQMSFDFNPDLAELEQPTEYV